MSYRRFSDCSVSEKLLDTMFLLLLSVGYLFAMVLLYTTISPLDGKPGLSTDDIRIKYYGSRSGTRLENALNGIMKDYRSKEEHATIIKWIYAGATKEQFGKKIAPIITKTCGKCHGPESAPVPDITTYEKMMTMVTMDTGESLINLVRVSHIHLFGLSMIFYLLGRMFLLTELPVWLKRVMVVIPFVAIFLDIGSWWFTHYKNVFAYSVFGGGALMGMSFAFQFTITIYQMWFYRPGVASDAYKGPNRRSERSAGRSRR